MELKYTEMRCRDIIENHLRPLLNAEKYEELIQVWNRIIQEKDIIQDKPKDDLSVFLIFEAIAIFFSIFLFNDRST